MSVPDLAQKKALQAAVRHVADDYLRDPNITSVGLGLKEVDGKPTEELELQFTVGRKLAPEGLEAMPTRPIPATISVNGFTFTTDVVEREFKPHPVEVAVEPKSERKRRLDPITPGVGIGHRDLSGGTLGCLVKDAATGEVQMLSNWHVLSGHKAHPGDTIVQPCGFDDNRVELNVAGVLGRTHLGLGGDCALAIPSARALDERVLELGVAVRRVGDPELGDVVVKSGRTSGVTFGRVTRIHTITKIRYEGVGETNVGGFEIGVHPDHPAEGNEISMPGDSGSAWLAVDGDGHATDMILGLHFAGETVEPAEWAAACYASAVFEKLEILPLDTPPLPEALAAAVDMRSVIPTGYDPHFLPGFAVATPVPTRGEGDHAATTAGALVRHYTHFSLAMSKSRRFAHWVAWNIDGAAIKKLPRTGLQFVLDAAYDPASQIGDHLYSDNHLDRGHIARRADLVWGSEAEAKQANVDSFFFTNITPQLDTFNQGKQGGLWGRLEDSIFADSRVDHLRVSLIGGPIFKDDDPAYRDVPIPRSFFKIVAWVENGALTAKAFVLTQNDLESDIEALGLEEYKVYQVPIAHLRDATGLDFGVLAEHDTMREAAESLGSSVRRIERAEDYVNEG